MLKWIVFISSLCSSLSTYHQVYVIYKGRTSENISLTNISCVWFNMLTHLVYSSLIKEIPLIITFTNSFVSMSTFVFFTVKYRNRSTADHMLMRETHELP